jgi:hypothetical protein
VVVHEVKCTCPACLILLRFFWEGIKHKIIYGNSTLKEEDTHYNIISYVFVGNLNAKSVPRLFKQALFVNLEI